MSLVKDVDRLFDVATGDADIGEHVVVQAVEDFGGSIATLPLEDRLEDVFHDRGFLALTGGPAGLIEFVLVKHM